MNKHAQKKMEEVVNKKDNRVFIGVIVAPWKFDVRKTNIFALEAIFVLRTSNFRGATISR